jgi:hypothetical protein
MKRLFGFAFAMLMLGSLAAWADPPEMLKDSSPQRDREVSESAYGENWTYNEVNEIWRCRRFRIEALSTLQGDYDQTRITVMQHVSGPVNFGYREVSCPVPQSALRVKSNSAEVDVSFDTEDPSCYNTGYGYQYDPELGEWIYSDWLYFGTVTVQAQLLSPAYEYTFDTSERNTQKVASSPHVQQRRVPRPYRREHIGPRYSGKAHFAFAVVFSLGGIALAALLENVQAAGMADRPAGFPVRQPGRVRRPSLGHASQGEGLGLVYERHAGQHHRFFTDRHMALEGWQDCKVVLFPAVLMVFYFGAFALPLGLLLAWLTTANVACCSSSSPWATT